MDYDIDYLQGRLLLSEPLSSTAEDNLLVRSSGLSGNEAYLVVRYEYTPGFDKLDEVAVTLIEYPKLVQFRSGFPCTNPTARLLST